MTQQPTYIYGKHALQEALTYAPQSIEKIHISDAFDDAAIKTLIKKSPAQAANAVHYYSNGKLPKNIEQEISDGAVHQGIVALITLDKIVRPYKDFVEKLEVGQDTCIILLGEVQDPQNVGAVIRSAAAFGVAAVLIPENSNQAQVTGTVVKVSAGMAFRIPLVSIGNVNSTVQDLKEKGFWVYGLDGESKKSLSKEKFDAPTLFILGNEATGIREKTLEHCDIVLSIPMNPQCESLNAATSAAVAMYAWSAQHPGALK